MVSRLIAGAAVGAAAVVAYRRWVKPWQERWGATEAEIESPLPGDEHVPEPATQRTRAISIDASPEDVWPWVVQIGADRGGFYSYDWLENLFGLKIHSAGQIVDAWQDLRVGEIVAADRRRSGGWAVAELEPGEVLALILADVSTGRAVTRDEGMRWEFLWTFAVQPGPEGGTRLLVRERTGFGSSLGKIVMAPVDLVSFAMTRRMLIGIRSRAETSAEFQIGA
ncbi:MAG: SRPBCC family protein [Microthrixaceae bacterium]